MSELDTIDSLAKLIEALIGLGGFACAIASIVMVWSYPERAIETVAVGYVLLRIAKEEGGE